ncbi:molybdopterin molybdotransferase MoeA [Saccharospirillum salsuginis]|uniref:Molybdopterin molybdenumtransferase n=1 Tax=Saccharospirillum salsuginis TaxID=418750 RepID=A0A918KK76_9GAMM|nr:molybdopterin molybdotransferase MoeA [Saccharospirillum salsuginis]GGX66336.1 molybdopterin molybdenumtransferase MoeA [Saccharospirillum salsuginis]
MGCCDVTGLMPLEEGLNRLLSAVTPGTDVETVPLTDALGRVTATPIQAQAPVPGFDNSAMDGYAIRLADLKNDQVLPLQGKAMAGQPFEGSVEPGHCIRIMTGAPVPEGCDAVVMQENTEVLDAGIRFLETPKPGNNIRRAGEDIEPGQEVIAANRRLKPVDLALIASVGCAEINVYRRVKVGLFSTGDEVRQPGEALRYGDLYDSNRPVIRALLDRLDVDILDLGTIPDDREAVRDAFLRADVDCDFVVTSGGVSVGEADYTKEILAELGEIEFWKLAIKPGKPFAFGRLPNSWFIGLPGNPVSATVTFHLLGAQAIRQFQGTGPRPLPRLTAKATTDLRKSPGRMDFQRGQWTTTENGIEVTPSGRGQGSHILTSLADANCYIALEQDRGNVKAGEEVTLWLFDDLMA